MLRLPLLSCRVCCSASGPHTCNLHDASECKFLFYFYFHSPASFSLFLLAKENSPNSPLVLLLCRQTKRIAKGQLFQLLLLEIIARAQLIRQHHFLRPLLCLSGSSVWLVCLAREREESASCHHKLEISHNLDGPNKGQLLSRPVCVFFLLFFGSTRLLWPLSHFRELQAKQSLSLSSAIQLEATLFVVAEEAACCSMPENLCQSAASSRERSALSNLMIDGCALRGAQRRGAELAGSIFSTLGYQLLFPVLSKAEGPLGEQICILLGGSKHKRAQKSTRDHERSRETSHTERASDCAIIC